ncbi:MAG TPA: WGR domain-containing protein [Candidatus Limnocylindria bacterium]|nr:WGR domain-containing protein [Candidatus Limnocylindria bacterium]
MLRAVDAKRNVRRSWSCRVGRDLLGDLVVSVTFGRTGTDGRTIRYAMADEASAERFMMKALRRRAGAERRCGAVYHLVEATGFAALPPAVMEARGLQAWRINEGEASGVVT